MDTLYNIALSLIKGIGISTAQLLLEEINGDAKMLFSLSKSELQDLGKNIDKKLNTSSKTIALKKAEEELRFIEKNQILPIFFTDKEYPSRLRECKGAPMVLFKKGACNLNALRCLSIVGTRKPTAKGIDITKSLVSEIANNFPNTLIISGLAYGIDITAHKEAINSGLPTVAVLGHGMQTIYPAVHKSFADKIVQTGGALLTQYRSNSQIFPQNFIERNCSIAGLSDATIVVESKAKGGALTTAKIASSYGRDVLAVPGSVSDEKSKGCNKLIKTNIAALIENVQDIAYTLNWDIKQVQQTQLIFDLSEEEQQIVNIFQQKGKLNIDNLVFLTKQSASYLLPIITQLEFKGVLLSYPGKFYSIRR